MSIEFRITSEFGDLSKIAEERNASPEWRKIFEIKPSIGRIVKLRGKLPTAIDIPDILYDLSDFSGINISPVELLEPLSKLAELEATYYHLAENLGTRAALSCGEYERIPDFIDLAKDLTAWIVWVRWKPHRGEDYIVLHRKIVHQLKQGLILGWSRAFQHRPFSYFEKYELERGTSFQEVENKSPQVKPIFRLRAATNHLALPSIIAGLENVYPLERIASLALMGYYPDGRGLVGVAKEIGVKKETLSAALDRASEILIQTKNGITPRKSLRRIVEELKQVPIIRYPSGKNVERTNPRLKLFGISKLPENLSSRERKIISFAIRHKEGVLIYSSKDIADKIGASKSMVCRVIKRAAVIGP